MGNTLLGYSNFRSQTCISKPISFRLLCAIVNTISISVLCRHLTRITVRSTDRETKYFHDWNFIVRVTLEPASIGLGFNNDPSNATADSPADFELKFQPVRFMIARIKRIEPLRVAVIFLLPADATALGAGDHHFSGEENAVQSGLLDSPHEYYYETRTASLMIYRSISSFNLAGLS